MRLFDLETDAFDRGEFFMGEVDDKAYAEIVEPFIFFKLAVVCGGSESMYGYELHNAIGDVDVRAR